MTGAPNGSRCRDKGARAERAAVAYLREHGWPDARRYNGADGRAPGDIDAIPGVSLEVKDRRTWDVMAWLRQAETEAAGRLPVVWTKRPGLTDPGDWPVILRARDLLQLLRNDT